MKICTITCHDVYNHGASLQAYALIRYLENCGHQAEIIDYKPDYLSNHYNLLSIDNPKWEKNFLTKLIYLLIKIPTRLPGLKRKKSFDKFKDEYLKISKSTFRSNDDLKKNVPQCEVFLCGSDQIWNCLHKNGKDPAFYLDFVPNDKVKASYAASFATETIPDELKSAVKERVGKLDRVSVREKSGVDILAKLKINNVVNVVDPVFLLPKKEWDIIGKKVITEKYLLIYDFDNSKLIKQIAYNIAKKKGIKIYCISSQKYSYADKNFSFDGPESFVSLVRDAQYIISNSFHAAVFSVLYEKDFFIVNRRELINTRMIDFLSDLKLSERLLDDNYSIENLFKGIDYTETKKILVEKINLSKKYLNEVLSMDKSMRNIL